MGKKKKQNKQDKELKKKRKKAKDTIDEIITIQDFLYENTPYYVLDYEPDIATSASGARQFYLQDGYEDWLDNNLLPKYADSVVRIAFSLMQFNYVEVYLNPEDSYWKNKPKGKYKKYVGYDIHDIGLKKLDKIIHHIILDWQDGMTLKFIDKHHNTFFMEIKDEWGTTFTNLYGENLKLVKELAKAEGFFLSLRQYDETEYEDTLSESLEKSDRKWKEFFINSED